MSSPVVGPLRWLGAIAVLGVIVALLVPMAMDAVSTSIEFRTNADDGGPATGETATDTAAPTDPDATGSPEPAEGNTAAETAAEGGGEGGGDAEAGPTEPEGSAATESPAEEDTGGSGDTLPETYTVQSGDTGYAIAERLYGDRDMWPVIAEQNDINAGSALQVGQELTLPAPE